MAAVAAEAGKGKALVTEDFNGDQLGPGWIKAKGDWKVVDGALQGMEVAADKHAAVLNRAMKYKDVVIELRFKMDGAKSFAVSANVVGGHLCRLSVLPTGFSLMKDANAKVPGDKAQVLGRHAMKIEPGKWYDARIEWVGPRFSAQIGDSPVITAENPAIDKEKATFALPVSGCSASFKYVHIWEAQ